MLLCPPRASAAATTSRAAAANFNGFTKKFSRTLYAKSTQAEAACRTVLMKLPKQTRHLKARIAGSERTAASRICLYASARAAIGYNLRFG